MYNIGICDDGENICISIEIMLLQYKQQLFKTQPLDFLVKAILQEQIDEVMGMALKIAEKRNERFEFYGKLKEDTFSFILSEKRRVHNLLTHAFVVAGCRFLLH